MKVAHIPIPLFRVSVANNVFPTGKNIVGDFCTELFVMADYRFDVIIVSPSSNQAVNQVGVQFPYLVAMSLNNLLAVIHTLLNTLPITGTFSDSVIRNRVIDICGAGQPDSLVVFALRSDSSIANIYAIPSVAEGIASTFRFGCPLKVLQRMPQHRRGLTVVESQTHLAFSKVSDRVGDMHQSGGTPKLLDAIKNSKRQTQLACFTQRFNVRVRSHHPTGFLHRPSL